MKSAAKVFIWIGMISGAIAIFPLVIGILALKKLDEAKTKDELTGWAIATVICCSTLGGIFMLCITEEELDENSTNQNPAQPKTENPSQSTTEYSSSTIEEELAKTKALYDKGLLDEEEYQSIRKSIISKHLN